MTQFIFANNAQSSLAGSISNTSTVLSVQAGAGALFPNPGSGQQFEMTLTDAATGLLREIVYVTQRVGDLFTIVRAQEGTTALNWNANDPVAELWTAGQCAAMGQQGDLQLQNGNYAVDSGSVNAYLVGLTPQVTAAPTAALPVRVKIKAGNTNTGASTLNAGWGAFAVNRRDGSACIGNEIVGSELCEFFWDPVAATFTILSMAPATNAAAAGGTDTASAITPAQLVSASFAPSGSMTPFAGLTPPTGWLLSYGQAISRTTYSNLFAAITASSTVTISIASPGVLSYSGAHNLTTGDIVSLETTGSLPGPFAVGTNYYAIVVDSTHIQLATTPANAFASTGINTTGSQSGVQTCRHNPYGCGDGSTTFNVPDGRGVFLFGADKMGGTAANRLSFAGSAVNPVVGGTGGAQSESPTISIPIGAGGYQLQTGGTSINYAQAGTYSETITIPIVPPGLGVNYIIKT